MITHFNTLTDVILDSDDDAVMEDVPIAGQASPEIRVEVPIDATLGLAPALWICLGPSPFQGGVVKLMKFLFQVYHVLKKFL